MQRLFLVAAVSLLIGAATPLYAQTASSDDGGTVNSEPPQATPLAPQQEVPAQPPAPPAQEVPTVPTPPAPVVAPQAAIPDISPDAAAPSMAVPDMLPNSFVQPVTKLQELIDTRLAKFVARKHEQEAVAAFYRARDYKPLWSADGAALPKADEAIAHLKNVASEGLDPRDYPTPAFGVSMTEDDAAAADLKLTAAVLTYARHASSGRVSFTRVSGSILYPNHALDPGKVLEQIAAADDLRPVLDSFEPQAPGFKALKAQLAKLMAAPTAAEETQAPPTRKGRNAGREHSRDTIGIVIANMERWRWLPRDLGSAYVMVNVPDFTLAVVDRGAQVWQTKIVAGKPGTTATPLLSETMKYLTINPTWNVPPSIIRNEYLPALERDPGALDRIGLKVEHNRDGSIRVYQPPGDGNALGHIRFNFPNPFLVYQHDTPTKNLFARDSRAFSHGCMRVQNPEKYAEVLLSISQPQEGYSIGRIKAMYGDEEKTIKLQRFIPVHVTYQTAFVDQSGRLNLRNDVYGLDAAVLKWLRGPERAVADVPIPRSYSSSSKPVMARLPTRQRERADDGSNGGGNEGRWSWNDNRSGWDRGRSGWDNGRSGWDSERAYAQSPRGDDRLFDRALGFW